MVIFFKFNPIQFRKDKYEINYEKDFAYYNPCRDNFLVGKNEQISFMCYTTEVGMYNVRLKDEKNNTIQIKTSISLANYVIGFSFIVNTVGKYWLEVEFIGTNSPNYTYFSERIIVSDDLQYTRVLKWKKTGTWLGYNLDNVYTLNPAFIFQKRLDISLHKNKTFGVQNIVFNNGWGKHELVDSTPFVYYDLSIGYLQGLNEYTQELIGLLRGMDFLQLDDLKLQITDETEVEFVDTDDMNDRRGMKLLSLSPYKDDYNFNLAYEIRLDPILIPIDNWLLNGGVWDDNGIWVPLGLWNSI